VWIPGRRNPAPADVVRAADISGVGAPVVRAGDFDGFEDSSTGETLRGNPTQRGAMLKHMLDPAAQATGWAER